MIIAAEDRHTLFGFIFLQTGLNLIFVLAKRLKRKPTFKNYKRCKNFVCFLTVTTRRQRNSEEEEEEQQQHVPPAGSDRRTGNVDFK